MDKKIRSRIHMIGYQIGLKSKYLENNNNRMKLINYIMYEQYETFIETMLQISLKVDVQLPSEIINYKGDKKEYKQAVNLFLSALTKGAVERLELKKAK